MFYESTDHAIRDAKSLGISRMIILGLQHMFAMFGATILVPMPVNSYFQDAAGRLIENVTKSVRRKAEVNDEFPDKLFSDVTSQYHLDQGSTGGVSGGKKEPGSLPAGSKALPAALAVTWVLIAVYYISMKLRSRK